MAGAAWDALLHRNDMSWKKVFKQRKVLKLDKEQDFVILDINRPERRISLGLRQLTEDPWISINNQYNENTRRNIRKALQSGCRVKKDFDAEKVISLALAHMKMHGKRPAENAERFRKLYRFLKEKGFGSTYGIVQGNELLASCVFFFAHSRAYYILVGNNPEGRSSGASHALIDAFIRDHAGQRLVLDFEGSDIPGLAAFYQGFGAINEPYPFLRINRLPFYLKWMK